MVNSSQQEMSQFDAILERATRLFMRVGIRSVSMDDIAKELGMSKKTLYQIVNNKEELVNHVMNQALQQEKTFMAEVREESEDPIHEMLLLARRAMHRMRNLSPSVLHDLKKYYPTIFSQLQEFHNEGFHEVIKDNLIRGQKQGLYRTDMNVDIISKLYTVKSILLADDTTFSTSDYNSQNLIIEHLTYHLRGISTEKGLIRLTHHRAKTIK